MILSEVNAVFDLVLKATSFYAQLKDGWYKGCSELDHFYDKVLTLSEKHSQWKEQLQRYGISEDRHLLHVVKLAEQALEMQQESIRKLQRSPFRRLKKRVFPGELSYLLEKVLQYVDAGPELLATKLANNDLLERYAAQTPTPLPFGPDKNYVPIVSTIVEVRSALESAEAARIVTVHGGPGMGKSCLAKHLAVLYVEEKQRLQMHASTQKAAVFPDGVYYLLCGRQADKRIKQLQLELLQGLGFEAADTAPIDSGTSSGVQSDYAPLPSLQMKLRSRLTQQKLLIILDDLWEETVLQELLVPAKSVKYLITSQRRDIFIPAKKIQIRSPTDVEARSIMANYTDGLPIPGQFPQNIQAATNQIIQRLEHHPLSLANIGVSINSSRVTDTKQWEVISSNLYSHLDENDLHPPAYDRAYSLPVSESMLLMVESLPAEAQRLLFLMTLLGGRRLPEPLVKFFYRFIQKTGFAVKYYSQEKFLEDKSLIENFRAGEDMSFLDCHSLRSRYIRDKKTLEVRSLGSQILIASGGQDAAMPIHEGDTEETLVAVLGGIYYDPIFKDIMRSTLENHFKVLNGGVMPRRLKMWTEREACEKCCDFVGRDTETLVCLLNVDHEGDWKKQAHEYAKKIIIKFAFQKKLDDDSIASLLKHPQTTSVACTALLKMCWCHAHDYNAHNITFSSAYRMIMETLLALLYDNGISTKLRAAVLSALLGILSYENKDTILEVGARYRAVLAMDSKSEGQVAMISVLSRVSGRGFRILTGSPGLLEDLTGILLFGKDHSVRLHAAESIANIVRTSTRLTLRISAFPNALQLLFDLFVSQDMFVADHTLGEFLAAAGQILLIVAIVPENRIKFTETHGIWEGLGSIIVKLEEAWQTTSGSYNRYKLVRRASAAAWILGNLGLEKDLRDIIDSIASLPGVRRGLQFLHTEVLSRDYNDMSAFAITRALTMLYSNDNLAMASSINLLVATVAFDGGPNCKTMEVPSSTNICSVYWSEVLAYILMGSYVESLSRLDQAQRHFDDHCRMSYGSPNVGLTIYCCTSYVGYSLSESLMRRCRVFLQAMLEDYTGAFQTASTLNDLALTGVLKRLSGDLQGALDDLNIAAAGVQSAMLLADTLKQRGYVKYLMGDETGARQDAEMAQQIPMDEEEWGGFLSSVLQDDLWDFKKLPVSYLGFSF